MQSLQIRCPVPGHMGLSSIIMARAAMAAPCFRKRCISEMRSSNGHPASGILALGKFGGVYGLVFDALPLWRPFRYPEKLLPPVLLLLALGAGAGFQALETQPRLRKGALWALGAFAFGAALVAGLEAGGSIFSHALRSLWSGTPSSGAPEQLGIALSRAGWLSAASAALLLGVIARVSRPAARQLLVVLGITSGLFLANESAYALTFPEVLRTPSVFVTAIEQREGPPHLGGYRVMSAVAKYTVPISSELTYVDGLALTVATALEADTPAIWGLESANGYLPATSSRAFALSAQGNRSWWSQHSGLFAARYLTVNAATFQQMGGNRSIVLRELPELELLLLRNPTAKPRAFLTRPHCVFGPAESLQWMGSPKFKPESEAIGECSAPLPVAGPEVELLGQVAVRSWEPERIELSIEPAAEALLVVSDAFYSGWTVTVDGQPREVLAVNHAARGVAVHPSERAVVFEYRTPGRFASLAVSLLSLLLVVGLLLVRRGE